MPFMASTPAFDLKSGPDTAASPSQLPFISVIMPVRNEACFIRHTIERLMHQRYPDDCFEVIVADGRSTDNTVDIVRPLQIRYDNLFLIDNPRRLSSAGRNAAIQACRGDCILVVDGHCSIEDDRHFVRLAAAFARSDADCLGRPQPMETSGGNRLQQAIAAARSSPLGHHPSSYIYSNREAFVPPHSVAVCYRRRVIDRVGPFDESFDACEDVEYNHRVSAAGFRCFFTPDIAVRYYPRSTLSGLFRQLVRYGRGRIRLLRKHPATFSTPGFVPVAFVVWLMMGLVLSVTHSFFLWPYVGSLLLYSGIVCASTIGLAVRWKKPSLCLLLPVVFFVIHFASGWGMIIECLAGIRGIFGVQMGALERQWKV